MTPPTKCPASAGRVCLAATAALVAACSGSEQPRACGTTTICPVDGAADVGGDGGSGDAAARDGDAGNSAGLSAEYRFDDGSGTVASDSSGAFRNGGLLGGVTWGPGRAGTDVRFDGATGHVVVPPHMLDAARELTISVWVRLRTDRIWQRVIDFGNDTNRYMFLTPHSDHDSVRFTITVGGVNAEQRIDTAAPMPTGSWQHLAVVLGAAGGTIYIDGQPAATTAVTLRPADLGTTTRNYFGRSQYSYDPYLDGELDQVRLYDRALSAAEIMALFTQP